KSSPTTQKLKVDIPNDKLIVSIQQIRHSSIPTRIQALVLVRQRLDGMKDTIALEIIYRLSHS
ncbi:unnamed protein product, partial [Rotaria magnacalcarata]